MHLSEGEIRAYQDHELSPETRQRVETHLGECPKCQASAAAILSRAQLVDNYLIHLDSDSSQSHTSVSLGRARLEKRLSQPEKENETMWSNLFTRIPRMAWVALAVVAILAISFAFAPVRAIANSFLGLFRVEQVRVVQFDPDSLAEESRTSESNFELIMSENVQFEEIGEFQEVADAAEASQLAGIPVRLPTELDGEPKLAVQPGGSFTYNVDLDLVRTVLRDMGRADVELPNELDGATVKMEIPSGVVALYGGCDFEIESIDSDIPDHDPAPPPEEQKNCKTFLQVASPTIEAPPGLNVAQIGEAYLQLLGMTQEEAANFARNVDWTTTLVIPIPRYSAEHQEVQVDGVTGTLVRTKYGQQYVLIWVKDGIVYALTGNGPTTAALRAANSLK